MRLDPGGGKRGEIGVKGGCRYRRWPVRSDFSMTAGMVVLKDVGGDCEMGVSFGLGC